MIFRTGNVLAAKIIGRAYQILPTCEAFQATPILMYHYIETPTATTTLPGLYLNPQIFESQLQEICRQRYNPVFVSAVATSLRHDSALAPKSVALSFDDGYEDFYTNAFPLLKKYEVKATIYVIINALDKPGYLSRAQVKEMAASGLVEIGSHTFNHPDLRKLAPKDANFEISDSRTVLQKLSGQPVLTFAYPYGDYEPNFFTILQSAGYIGAVSVDPGACVSGDNVWLMPRLRPDNLSGEKFARWLADWFSGNLR